MMDFFSTLPSRVLIVLDAVPGPIWSLTVTAVVLVSVIMWRFGR